MTFVIILNGVIISYFRQNDNMWRDLESFPSIDLCLIILSFDTSDVSRIADYAKYLEY